jgi:tRNA threonylcarbamoyladenosine biosynthesis protein TsaB
MEFYMLVLALDTTTRPGSIALARDGVLAATSAGDAGTTHGERLPGDLLRVLEQQALNIRDVDVFAVACGPGSFTGLRIGIAAMQGLALANDKSLVGISALDAIDESVHPASSERASGMLAAWMDAQRGQVFSAVYENGAVVEEALVDKPAEILARWRREGRQPQVFAGDGALAYRHLIGPANPAARIVEPVPPLAPAVARLAAEHIRRFGPSAPDAIRPLYVRRSDAELARDRLGAGAAAPPALERQP